MGQHVYRKVMTAHAVGRTCPSLGSLVTHDEVDALREGIKLVPISPGNGAWAGSSVVQKLDYLATSILCEDRGARSLAAGVPRHGIPPKRLVDQVWGEYPHLTPDQWWRRAQKELSWPDLDGLAAEIRAYDRVRLRSMDRVVNDITGGFGLRNNYKWVGFREGYVDRVGER